jgi:ribosomal protein L37AE/L43A
MGNAKRCKELGMCPEQTLKELPAGSIVGIACPECEGHEDHRKLPSGEWVCNWCRDVKDMNTD